MNELIVALTNLAIAATRYLERENGQPNLPFPAAAAPAAEAPAKAPRKPKAPKEAAPPTAPPMDDGLGLDDTPPAPAIKKEMTEKEILTRVDEVTRQFVRLCKNDTPEDGTVMARKLLTETFHVSKLGDLVPAQRLAWIAQMEKWIGEHK